MRFFELLKFSAGNLWRRKLRTILTILGVLIGTASIVVMMSLGVGINESYTQQIENSSTLTLITVRSNGGYYMDPGASDDQVQLTEDTIGQFSTLEHVETASQVYNFSILAKSGRNEAWLDVNSMSLEMLYALDIPLAEGEMPKPGEDFQLIVGKDIGISWFYDPYADWSMGYQPPVVDLMNDTVFVVFDTDAYYEGEQPKKYILDTCAIAGSPEEGMWTQHDYMCYADFEAVDALFSRLFKKEAWPNQSTDNKGKPITPMVFHQAYVLVDDVEHVSAVQTAIQNMGFQAYSDLDYISSIQETSRSIQYLLGGIGAVSLLVAAICITNTMMMSIFERTKEIGIFKVLGCPLSNIRSMFLAEAGLIGFLGGVAGLGLSYGLSAVINLLTVGMISGTGSTSIIPLWLALLGVGVAVVVAMVAGLSPAIRAMRLSPLEAIRSL